LFKEDIPLILDNYSIEYNNLIRDMRNNAHIKQAVFVFNLNTKELMPKFDGILLAEK